MTNAPLTPSSFEYISRLRLLAEHAIPFLINAKQVAPVIYSRDWLNESTGFSLAVT